MNYALIEPRAASDAMPSVWVSKPSSINHADDTVEAPLDTQRLLAGAVSNYVYVLKEQASTPSQQTPQSCLISYTINMTSHPAAFKALRHRGTLSLTFSPLTTSNDGGNKVLEKRAANVAPRQQFAFDSSVTSVAIFVDIANSTIQKCDKIRH